MFADYDQTTPWLARILAHRTEIAADVDAVLRLDGDGLRAWRERALAASVAHACRNSPFYRARIGDGAAELTTRGDVGALARLPFTTREDLMESYPFGFLATPREGVARFGESSGTAVGKPIAAYFTARDWITNNCTVAHFLGQVLSPGNLVAVAVPYELAGVAQDLDRSLELCGCAVVALGALSQLCPPERMVDIIQEAGVTALICSGTRALYLAEVARSRGWDPRRDFRVSRLLFAGEGASAAKRRTLSRLWGASTHAMYGMTETNTLGMFCSENELHLIENRSWFEVVSPETGQPTPAGKVGELVVTSLQSEAMPLVRYRTGDLCSVDEGPCGCGSAFRRLRHHGRIADRVSVNQQVITQMQLEDVIMSRLDTAPYYFSFKAQDDGLTVGLTANNMTERVRRGIEEDLGGRYRIRAAFTLMEIASFERSLRTAVKPTMKSFLLK